MADVRVYMKNLTPSWSGYPQWGIGPVCSSPEAQEEWMRSNVPELSITAQSSLFYHEKWKLQPIPAASRLPGGKALIDHMSASLMSQDHFLSPVEREMLRFIEGTLALGRVRSYVDVSRAEVYQIGSKNEKTATMFWIDAWLMNSSQQYDVFCTWWVKFIRNRRRFPWVGFGEVIGVSVENVMGDDGKIAPGLIYLGDPGVAMLWIYTAKPQAPRESPLQFDCGAPPDRNDGQKMEVIETITSFLSKGWPTAFDEEPEYFPLGFIMASTGGIKTMQKIVSMLGPKVASIRWLNLWVPISTLTSHLITE